MKTQAALCQQCGRPVEAGAQFCAQCGANVSDAQGSAATALLQPASVTAQIQDLLLDQLREAALGEYEILTELGRGGMATVYLAHDIQLDRRVAIKVMLPALLEGEGMIERFKLEARTAGQLSHPHIIPIFAVRDTENLLFFVMKFVEGRPLDSIVGELGQTPIPIVQFVLSKVGEALGYAHRRGVVHRDIKPANIMVDVEGLPVVTDFGIAKVGGSRGLTMTGATVGTPTYMSPEQCAAGAITGASDQYSLGCVAYEMLTGKTPFHADTVVSLLYMHCHEPPKPFMDVRPDCPPALHDAVMRMLAKKPADRFPSLEEAIEAIGTVNLAFNDPSRVKLIEMAKASSNVALLKRISTPRSPTPIRTKATKKSAVATRAQAGATARQPAAATQAPATIVVPARSTGPVIGAIAGTVAVIALVGLAWLKPWEHRATPTDVAPGGLASSQGATGAAATPAPGAATPPTAGADSARPAASATPPVTTPAGRTPPNAARPAPGALSGAAPVSAPAASVAPRVAAVAVTSPPGPLVIGATTHLTATVTGDDGRPLAASVTWRTADPGVATVNDGVVTAVGAGSTAIIASAEGHDATATVRVSAPAAAAPATPPPVTQAAPAAPVDAREAIGDVITQYARALESGQVSEVRRVYPSLTRSQADQVQALGTYQDLQVQLTHGPIDVRGNDATTTASGEYQFYSRENRRTEHLPVHLRITLQNGPNGWLIRSVQ